MIRNLERLLGWGAAACLFAMMALTFVDVVSRKLLYASVPGSVEVTELLMLVVIFTALPLASLRGEHVFFDLLDYLLPERLRRVQSVISNAFCAALLVGASWLVFRRAQRTAEFGDMTAQLQISIAEFHYMAAAMLLLTAVMHVYLMLARDLHKTTGASR
ncbi:MAG TPA: TRAP transporter small permease [Burkholderiaceae bacterium]|nr:TRAP transporter small permease [Burkholderiaceae bacterium]